MTIVCMNGPLAGARFEVPDDSWLRRLRTVRLPYEKRPDLTPVALGDTRIEDRHFRIAEYAVDATGSATFVPCPQNGAASSKW